MRFVLCACGSHLLRNATDGLACPRCYDWPIDGTKPQEVEIVDWKLAEARCRACGKKGVASGFYPRLPLYDASENSFYCGCEGGVRDGSSDNLRSCAAVRGTEA